MNKNILSLAFRTSQVFQPEHTGSAQMLGRVRDLKKNQIFVFVKQAKSNATTSREKLVQSIERKEEASYRACGLPFDRKFGSLLSTPFSELYISNKLRNNRSKKNFLSELTLLLESQGITVEKKVAQDEEDVTKECSKVEIQVKEGQYQDIASAPEIGYDEFLTLDEKRDKSYLEKMSCQKFLFAEHFGLDDQSLVTVPFLRTYAKAKTHYRTLCLTFGDDVEEKLRENIERDVKRRRKTREQLLVREKFYNEKVYYLWKMLKTLEFDRWWEKKKMYKEKFEPLLAKVYRDIFSEAELFKALFGTLPKDEKKVHSWLNSQLVTFFGLRLASNRRKDYIVAVMFCEPWDLCNEKVNKEHFVPKIVPY
ncbi:hypothetical protein GMAR_ORF3 [Golden Marseillevirus]|uniref:hypothetical protein n=1 Tax=Golden Marseillevirus TaxID=1720526 RepID=UPI000877AC5D|nr:hypothetical protein GMAR_ORF3 [Golden Marseillevirus]ALX27378.1 hypothetical protein GMAR_ORF3 [Golden Marseillevirus]